MLKLTRARQFDVVLVAKDLPGLSSVDVTRIVRQREEGLRLNVLPGSADSVSRLPIIVLAVDPAPEHLREFMECGMDGCISLPVDKGALLNTVSAAVPKPRGSPPRTLATSAAAGVAAAMGWRTDKLTSALGSTSKSRASVGPAPAAAPATLPMSPVRDSRGVEAFEEGVFSPIEGLSIPYQVLGRESGRARPDPMFHFVVINDFFDTMDRHALFFRPLVQQLPGLQVLLFNLPGQAGTTWHPDSVLTNDYYAACTRALLHYLGPKGNGHFMGSSPTLPFYILGCGNGANIATCFAMRHHHEFMGLRALLLVNGFLHVDTQLAGILHDSINVFTCTPPGRLDLPLYFFSRFLFSQKYIDSVGPALALNLYTAVANNISHAGRIAICRGALAHTDLRTTLDALVVPVVMVASPDDTLVSVSHSKALLEARGSLTAPQSIAAVLTAQRARATVLWMEGGHEVFQTCKRAMKRLVQQLAVGFHDVNDIDVAAMPALLGTSTRRHTDGGSTVAESRATTTATGLGARSLGTKSVKKAQPPSAAEVLHGTGHAPASRGNNLSYLPLEDRYLDSVAATTTAAGIGTRPLTSLGAGLERSKRVSLPELPPGPAATALQLTQGVNSAQTKEYMQWRLKRNQKRLARFDGAAAIIQRAYRSHIARNLTWRVKNHHSALNIQRWWRMIMARAVLAELRAQDWAARLLQRMWRGYSGRLIIWQMFMQRKAALAIQRCWRGCVGRSWVKLLRAARRTAAIRIQSAFRAYMARVRAFRMRDQRIAATNIQRVFRGRCGRLRAMKERERYLFSRSQHQGIEFGRQMLSEHRLHGTKLQSEVALLGREKIEVEARLELVLQEISSFEAGVRALEHEMATLTKAETQAAGTLDEAARVELKENKLRLDREFSGMLVKIADRREILTQLEKQLQMLDRTRAAKKDELRQLERKLVVLLEEQHSELQQIKARQSSKKTRMVDDVTSIVAAKGSGTTGGWGSTGAKGSKGAGDGDDGDDGHREGSGGPTLQQRAEASALMASTETMMKFGFMSMSMTYFSSLNMIKAMRQVGAANTLFSNPMVSSMFGTTGAAPAGAGALEAGAGGPSPVRMGATVAEFKPQARPGVPAGAAADVTLWTIADVAQWLDVLSLGQYKHVFAEAAVDGPFLMDLTDEDLRNTLGIEHSLHRKKVLIAAAKLRQRGPGYDSHPSMMGSPPGRVGEASSVLSTESGYTLERPSVSDAGRTSLELADGPKPLRLEELMSWVRHNKGKKLVQAFNSFPEVAFDTRDVLVQYLDDFGTQYQDVLARQAFHINSADQHGNTLLIVACQNGHQGIATLLLRKGANPNHQNRAGCTALHYAMEYGFYDLGAWLADPSKGGAADDIVNKAGLSPYDGIG